MPRRKKSYTKLLDYIETVDLELHQHIEELILEYLFQPKNNVGRTLLLPVDSKYKELLKKFVNSDDEEEIDKATQMISSLVIMDCLKTPADFMEKRDDIPNALGQRIEIDRIEGRSIILKTGAILKIDDRFVDGSKNKKLAVWTMENGGVDINGPKASFKYVRKKKNSDQSPELTENDDADRYIRQNIANKVENAYTISMSYQNRAESRDVYLETVLNLVSYMLKNEYCKEILIDKVIPMLSFDKTDFYLIFEPYKTVGPYLISNRIIKDWYENSNKNVNYGKVLTAIDEILSNPEKNQSSALIYANAQGALNKINEKREYLLNMRCAPQNIIPRIQKTYDELFREGIFPKPLLEYYNSPNHKMVEDEFRFTIYQMFLQLESRPDFDYRYFSRIIDFIRDYTDGPDLRPILFREMKIQHQLPPKEKIGEIKIFINSTAYFYIPLSQKTLENFPHDCIYRKPNPSNISYLYNITNVLFNKTKRYREEHISKSQKKDNKSKTYQVDDEYIKSMLRRMKEEGKLEKFMEEI